MGPKRTQYERCRKALNALDLVESLGELSESLIAAKHRLEDEFTNVQGDVLDARQRFEKARARQSDLNRMCYDPFWGRTERENLQQMERLASAELNMAEAEWNDI